MPRNNILFNLDWQFLLKDTPNFFADDWQSIKLPHDWSIAFPFSSELDGATGYLPGGIGWYKKPFANPISRLHKKAFLVFDGIYNHSQIWLNGTHLHTQHYGYSPFIIDITRHLEEENELLIKVDRTRFVDSRWYTGSGIYRDVNLVMTDKTHIGLWQNRLSTPKITPSYAEIHQDIEIEFSERHQDKTMRLVSKVVESKKVGALSVSQHETKVEKINDKYHLILPIKNPKLWDTDTPFFYTVVTELYIDNVLVDITEERCGVRSIHFDTMNGFFLNNRPMKIQGVCLHHDGGIVGAAVPREVWQRRLTILKCGGVNAIRIAHNPASKVLLDLCDELGLLVQDEFFDEWDYPKDKRHNMGEQHADYYSRGSYEYFQEDAEKDLTNTLLCHHNHPSIFMWSIGNEIEWTYPRNVQATGFFDAKWDGNYFWSLPPNSPSEIAQQLKSLPKQRYDIGKTAQKLTQWVKKLDPHRPVTANCILPSVSYLSGYSDALDVIGYSYRRVIYDYGHQLYPHLPIIGNESLPQWHEWKAVIERPFIAGLFLWTGINYLGESHNQWPTKITNSGLLDTAGFKKPSYFLFQSLWTETPITKIYTHPASSSNLNINKANYLAFEKDPHAWEQRLWSWHDVEQHWNYENGDWIIVEVISNCPSVELWINEITYGVRHLTSQNDHIMRWAVPFTAGSIQARGLIDDRSECIDVIATTQQAYLIKITEEAVSDNDEVKQFVISILDENNNPITHQDTSFILDDMYNLDWIGSDNGNINTANCFTQKQCHTYQGKTLLMVRIKNQNAGYSFSILHPHLGRFTYHS
ncbi:threonine synthase [Vibrio sp. 10N.286.49.C2]|uniref:glycoside hydrolase family 2 TIM barrel-domain containing protein n=1 Tax=unclassified Vibrio TaxID=2614977 RepID=UPI000C84330F|nr:MULTISPECIES: glycoside hydrolase family 2 TIM barrel-domain containing protein [unclassified Vibrio]PMH26386.1 threonine synthase [Vibrio sp. 10N.286.49.C2]PMH54890.1 threonine synthase [Vibrio sp. 10N.286.49.B1]PMH79582.1 threonine synthase [Vibrio sp. 10N.286.48.B7]